MAEAGKRLTATQKQLLRSLGFDIGMTGGTAPGPEHLLAALGITREARQRVCGKGVRAGQKP